MIIEIVCVVAVIAIPIGAMLFASAYTATKCRPREEED